MLNLDTHILIRALSGGLTPGEKRLLAGEQWGISAIVLWELAKLSQLGRIGLDIDAPEFARAQDARRGRAAGGSAALVGRRPLAS